MAQFGGKNPPWAREAGQSAGVTMVGNLAGQQMLSQPGVATQAVYSLGGAQPQHQFSVQQGAVPGLQVKQAPLLHPQAAAAAALQQSVQLPQPGIAIPTTLATTQVATVSYPAPRAAGQGPQPKQRVFTGTVTKLHDNFGFVDEDVFFQTSCVKGNLPKVGDRVLVEAAYNANMPFKWNATRIQVLPNQPPPGSNPPSSQTTTLGTAQPRPLGPGINQQGMQSGPTPLMAQQQNPSKPNRGGRGGRDSGGGYRSSDRDRGGGGGGGGHDRHTDRGRHRGAGDRERARSPPTRRRSRSPRRRSRSPRSPSRSARSPVRSRRPARTVPRYNVHVPKLSLDTKEANVMTLKSRYNNMYIPSDFFNASFTWTDAFPMHRPLQLGQPCTFHVMHKEVDALDKQEAVLEPPDADHLYSAKVMLMSSPMVEELYHKSCALAEDSSDMKESFQHPTRLLQFLVGLKGKSEPMAIGGPWSPSLDGQNPAEDPRVLINTAIRTTRALTGIDLGVCTQWYRFADIRYHRPEEVHKGRTLPARVETVVLFLPDVWSCNPSRLEWEQMTVNFKKQLADKLVDENKEDTQEDEGEDDENAQEKKDPSHYSDLDPKIMKVNDLRCELEARSLSSKGLKSQLIARLTKALKSEQEKEEQEAAEQKEEEEEKPTEPEEKPEVDDKEEERKRRDEEERKRREERERAARERRYTLPDNPSILVHPSTTAKGGKFDCTVMSLSVLLDYRPDDNKEHTFEVSLFAELFNEMLMRDSGFLIYKALVAAPEKPKEEKKDKEKKETGDKEKKDEKDEKDKDKKKEEDKEDEEPPSKKRKGSEDEKEKKEEKEEEKKKDKEKSKDEEDEEDEEDDDKSTTTSDGRKDREPRKSKDKKRGEKVKYQTIKPDLLLAFVYFDQSHSGYLLDKDVEEIMHTLGLTLSRAQIKKLVNKLISRDMLNYRKITDKAIAAEKKEETTAAAAPTTTEGEKPMEEDTTAVAATTSETTVTNEETEEAVDDEALAQGNKPLLVIPKKEQSASSTPSRSSKRGAKKDDGTLVGDNMVIYKGAMLDINSVMQRLEKSEKTKRDTEAKLKETQEDMEMIKSSFNSSEQNSQKVALELQELKKKLRDQRKATDRAEHDCKKYYDILARNKSPLTQMLNDIKEIMGENTKEKEEVKKEIKSEVNGDN